VKAKCGRQLLLFVNFINTIFHIDNIVCCLIRAQRYILNLIYLSKQSIYFSDHYKPDDKTSGVPNSFDFATTQDVQLDLKYDVPVKDYQVLFELYFENPLTTDAEGQVVKRTDITPKVTRMTDGTGKYRAKETVPAYGEEVYLYFLYRSADVV